MQCWKLVTELEIWSINKPKTLRNYILRLQASQVQGFFGVFNTEGESLTKLAI